MTKKVVEKKLDSTKDFRIKGNKRNRIEAHARRMAKHPADPNRGKTRFKRRYDKQRSYTDAYPDSTAQ